MTKRIGLTLGKFAPLHRGHELLIETALDEVEHLIVLVYDCPETTPVPLGVRAQWIRDLYPSVEVIEAVGGPTEVDADPRITRAHDDYILAIVGGRGVTHFYSSEFYGAHVAAALGAVDRRIDPDRHRVPISATRIREDAYACRQFVSSRVYRDLVAKVVLLGAPSTGKTTLCRALAERYCTVWAPEYGREYWEIHQVDRRLSPQQLFEIAAGHLEREEALLLHANRFLFADTNAITTLLFARHYHGAALPALEALASQCVDRYAQVFVCGDDFPYEDTWDRSGEANRRLLQQWTIEELERCAIAFVELRGPLEARIAAVDEHLRRAFPAIASRDS